MRTPAPAPFSARERERRALRERLDAALAGQGSLVLVGGEAGIGKTTLVDWLAHEARQRGALVLAGQCYDLAQAPLYGPWREALADHALLADIPHPLQLEGTTGEIAGQEVLFTRVCEYLTRLAERQPLLFVLEDLHWADPASLDLLRSVARGLDGQEILLVATHRIDPLTRHRSFAQMLPHLVREARAERIDLARLTAEDVRVFLNDRYALAPAPGSRLAAYVIERAGGNPFYLDELLRTLKADQILRLDGDNWVVGDLSRASVPPLVRQIIESRLQGLGADTERLLGIAAVIGQDVPLSLWQAVSGADDGRLAQAIDQGVAAHLLLEGADPASVRFVHALVRETLYTRQAARLRRQSHQRTAELLVEWPEPPLSEVASHFASADDPRAIEWLIRAGEQALSLYAARDAVEALNRAHAVAGRQAITMPAAAYRSRAIAAELLGEFDSARHDYELVLERARGAGDRRAEFQALLDLGQMWAARDYDRTGTYYRTALDLAQGIADERLIARGLNRIANLHVNLDEADLARPLHLEALAICERLGDRGGIAETLDLLAMACYLDCDNVASTTYYERAIPLFRELNDRPRLAFCLSMLALTGNDLEAAIAPTYREGPFWLKSAEEGLEIAREIGWSAGESFAHFSLCVVAGVNGQFDRAMAHAREAERVAQQIDHHQWTIAAHCALASVWTALLDFDRATADLEQGLAAARVSGSRYWTNQMAGRLALSLIAGGQPDRAAALLGNLGRSDRPARSMGLRHCWLARIELLLARKSPERALDAITALAEVNPEAMAAPGPPLILKLRGDALVQLGRLDYAAQVYEEARESAALYGYRAYLWQIDAARGSLFVAQGRQVEADAARQSARNLIDDLAATLSDEAMREQFRARALALLPAAEPEQQPAPAATTLSPRELDVLRLIAEGQSDREIADALSISPRTVMRHVTGILTKLDVPSRTAAATLAIRQGIV